MSRYLSTIPTTISVSEFIGQIKGFCAFEINKLYGDKYIEWQEGFGVVTLSRTGIPFVKKYIKNQKKHHLENTIVDILEKFLAK